MGLFAINTAEGENRKQCKKARSGICESGSNIDTISSVVYDVKSGNRNSRGNTVRADNLCCVADCAIWLLLI